jgi:3' exoribonuclease family, domain 1
MNKMKRKELVSPEGLYLCYVMLSYSQSQKTMFECVGLRQDGRRVHELRRFLGKLGLLAGVNGSAYVEQGNTKVLVTVMGPREVRMGSIL